MTRLILVLGSHRAGTSLITKSLTCLGVDLGDNLQGPAPDNPAGFWENLDIQRINDRVLHNNGAAWDTLGPIDLSKPQVYHEDAYFALAGLLRSYPLFGLKDPRMCRLLPFWKPIFKELGVEVSCVIALRHPSEVMHSLHARNGFSEAKGFALWLVHMLDAMTQMEPEWKKVVVDYDQMMETPLHQLSRIAEALDLLLTDGTPTFVENFVNPKLRHAPRHVGAGSVQHDLVNRVYDLLYDISRDNEPVGYPSTGKFMAYAEELKGMTPLLRGLDAAEKKGMAKLEEVAGTFKWPA